MYPSDYSCPPRFFRVRSGRMERGAAYETAIQFGWREAPGCNEQTERLLSLLLERLAIQNTRTDIPSLDRVYFFFEANEDYKARGWRSSQDHTTLGSLRSYKCFGSNFTLPLGGFPFGPRRCVPKVIQPVPRPKGHLPATFHGERVQLTTKFETRVNVLRVFYSSTTARRVLEFCCRSMTLSKLVLRSKTSIFCPVRQVYFHPEMLVPCKNIVAENRRCFLCLPVPGRRINYVRVYEWWIQSRSINWILIFVCSLIICIFSR